MERTDILASAASGITCILDSLKNAKIMTTAEYNLIWNVLWGVVVDAKAAENTLREDDGA